MLQNVCSQNELHELHVTSDIYKMSPIKIITHLSLTHITLLSKSFTRTKYQTFPRNFSIYEKAMLP